MKLLLTDDVVAATQPNPKGELVLSDTLTKGLRLKVTPAGGRVFFCQYRGADGKQRKHTLGSAADMTVKTARDVFALTMQRVKDGRDPQAEKTQAQVLVDNEPTLAQAWASYDARVISRERKPDTAIEYRRMWDKYVPTAFKSKLLANVAKVGDPLEKKRRIGRTEIQELKDRMAGTPTMANNVLKTLKAFFNWCEGDGELTAPHSNPLHKFKFYENKHRHFVFTPEQLKRLAVVLMEQEKRTWPPAIQAIRFLLMTGFRKEEALRLRWADIDLSKRKVLLPDTKTGSSDRVLGVGAIEVLEQARAFHTAFGSEFVFPATHDRTKPFLSLQKVWDRCRKAAGLPNVRIHDLKHNFGGYGARMTSNAITVRDLLGHAQIGTTDGYMKSQSDHLVEAADSTTNEITKDMKTNVVRMPGR